MAWRALAGLGTPQNSPPMVIAATTGPIDQMMRVPTKDDDCFADQPGQLLQEI